MAQRLGVADPGHEQEREQEKRARQPVVSLRQRQERARTVEKPFLEQRRHRRSADAPRPSPPPKPRRAPRCRARPGPLAPPGRAGPARCGQAGLPGCPQASRPFQRLRFGLRVDRAADEALVEVVIHGRCRNPEFPGQSRAAHPRGQKAFRPLLLRARYHAGPTFPARLVEACLALFPQFIHRSLQGRTADPERGLDVRAPHSAFHEPGGAQQHRTSVGDVVDRKAGDCGNTSRSRTRNRWHRSARLPRAGEGESSWTGSCNMGIIL